MTNTLPAKKIADYLYVLNYDDIDYAAGTEYMEKFHYIPSACSQVLKGNLIGRNYDWYYSNQVEFIVRTPTKNGRHATIGVAYGTPSLTKDFVEAGTYTAEYDALPFMCTDCMNDAGIYCSINVVPPGDCGYTYGTNPGADINVCQMMLPRYICDYAGSLSEVDALLSKANIFAPLQIVQEEIHMIVSDGVRAKTYEFIDNQIHVVDDTKIVTNFYLDGWSGEVKTVALGFSEDEVRATGLTDHAMGVERYNILAAGYDSVNDESGMMSLMSSVKYTEAYNQDKTPFWYSEFTGETQTFGDLTIYSAAADYDGIRELTKSWYDEHSRDAKNIWQTVHTSVYDLNAKTLCICVQEDYENPYTFTLENPRCATQEVLMRRHEINQIGHEGDHNAVTAKFSVNKIIDGLGGDGTFRAWIQRPDEGAAYRVSCEYQDKYVYVTFTSDDVANVGIGRIQLDYVKNDSICCSDVYKFAVRQSLQHTI